MSTYIVAFANGPFVYLEDFYESPLSQTRHQLRIYGKRVYHSPNYAMALLFFCAIATPDLIGQGDFALDVTKKALPEYERMFGIEYPLPKLDTLIVGSASCVSS